MIQALPLLLARAHRKRQPLLLCEVTCVEQIEACLEAANQKKAAIGLTLSVSTSNQQALVEMLLPIAQFLAQRSKQPVGLELRLTTPQLSNISPSLQIEQLCIAVPTAAHHPPLQGDVIGICTSLMSASKADSSFHALRVPAELSWLGLSETLRQLKRPLILEEASMSPARLKTIVRSGIAGISLAEQLDASFTAGVRTALRNRELSDPSTYLRKGRLAVRERVINYLNYLEA